jgi:tRNA threonylcarbamoyladenosine biosynthesis protein TsaE
VTVLRLADEPATEAAGRGLAAGWLEAGRPPLLLALEGDLGAGKTTLVRGLLRMLGEPGTIRSPTYTLLESYRPRAGTVVHHLDCYRLAGWPALEELGFRDLLEEAALIAIEWPGRIPGLVESVDLRLELAVDGAGRRLVSTASTPRGRVIEAALKRLPMAT